MKAEDFLGEEAAVAPQAPIADIVRAALPAPAARRRAGEFLHAKPASENLPDTLKVFGFDTGIELGPQLGASLVNLGGKLAGSYRGAKQLLGLDKMGRDPKLSDLVTGKVPAKWSEEEANETLLRELEADPSVGTSAKVGGVVGSVLDPVVMALPLGRAKTIAGMAKGGAAGGAVAGGLSPLAEGEGVGTRAINTVAGAGLGAAGAAAIGGGVNAVRFLRGKETIPLRARPSAEIAIRGGVVARPEGPQPTEAAVVAREAAEVAPVARVTPTTAGAEPRAAGGTLGFLGGGQVGQAAKELGRVYGKYVGEPLLEAIQRNPGSSLGAAFGATTGYRSADEDAPVSEKIGRAAAGALLGFGTAKGVGRIPTRGGNVSASVSRAFIDNFGLPAEYVAAKQQRSGLTNQIQDQFLDVAREAAKLGPAERRLLYNMLEGTKPEVSDLAGLSDRTRKTITEWGQRMVDYGLLDPETFTKNAATYLHREYLSKLNPAAQAGVVQQIRLLGQELRPRGVFKIVPQSEAQRWIDLGWEPFGTPRGGEQQLRWQLTKDQRLALGEIEDAAYSVARTGQLMSNDIATYKFFDDVARSPRLAADADPGGWVRMEGGKVAKTQVNRLGNLEGKFVPPEVARDLKLFDMARAIRTSDNPLAQAFRAYQQLNSWWKVSKTALNPTVHVNNVLSNVLLYDLADADYRRLGHAALEMRREGEFFKQAKALGVFDASMNVQELRNLSNKSLEAYADLAGAADNPVQSSVNFVKKGWEQTGGRMIDFYQKEDSVFRLGVFMDRLSKGATPEKAAADARRWFIDYDISAPGINVLRQTATPFIAYTYRAVPLLTESAALRPWKFAKWAAIGWGLNAIGEKYGGGDTAKERALMPEQQKGNVFGAPFMPPQQVRLPALLLGPSSRERIGIGDTPQYLDITRYIPGGDVFDTAGEHKMLPWLPAPAQPSGGAAGSVIQAMTGSDWFRDKKLAGLGLSDWEDAKIKGRFLLQQFLPNNPLVPGSFSQDKIIRSAFGHPSPAGDALPLWQAVLHTVGVKIRPADLTKLQMRAMLETQRDVQAIQEQVSEAARDVQAGKVSEERFRTYAEDRMAEAVRRVERLQKRLSRSSSPEPLEAN